MSERINQIVEQLKELTLLEASELITKIEQTFGVDASASFGGNALAMAIPQAVELVEEQTEFTVLLETVPADKKIAILKVVRAITGLGLKEAKELVEKAPVELKKGVKKEVAEEIKKKLSDIGAVIEFL